MDKVLITGLVLVAFCLACNASDNATEEVDPETYTWVLKKMDEYCSKAYTPADDRIIQMYSGCFSDFLKADHGIVQRCRMTIYKNNRALKMADCIKDESPETEKVRNCIGSEMMKKQPEYKFEDIADEDMVTHDFFECMQKVFR